MDDKMNQETQEALLQALSFAKKYKAEADKRRERKLWQEVNVPPRLPEVVDGLTKDDMTQIRQMLGLKNLSSLKKQELANELVKLIPLECRKVFMLFDEERYHLARQILENGGFTREINITAKKIEHLRESGIIFTGSKNGNKVLTMPLEVLEVFEEMDGPVFQKLIRRNTEWIRLAQGLLYYYGVLGYNQLRGLLEKHINEDVGYSQQYGILSEAASYYGQIRLGRDGYYNARVNDVKEVLKEHRARPDLPFYPFTKEELLKAGEEGYVDRTEELDGFVEFLLENYEMTTVEAEEIALHCIDLIKLDGHLQHILQYLGTQLDFSSLEDVQQLTGEVVKLSNNTRKWILKGHTSEALFQEEKKYLNPLPGAPFNMHRTGGKVIDINTRRKGTKKIGRNDPCPCGSGKKYKKCCGRS